MYNLYLERAGFERVSLGRVKTLETALGRVEKLERRFERFERAGFPEPGERFPADDPVRSFEGADIVAESPDGARFALFDDWTAI